MAVECSGPVPDEALRLYCERFGFARGDPNRDRGKQQQQLLAKADALRGGVAADGRRAFGWSAAQKARDAAAPLPGPEMLAELERDLGLEAGSLTQAALRGLGAVPLREIEPTFSYAGSLDRTPHLAKFDVRDWVCSRAGGFTHGQVVRDQSGQEFAVIGVKRVDGQLRLFFQPVFLDRRAAGAFPNASAQVLQSRLTLVPDCIRQLEPAPVEDYAAEEDSDGEAVLLCPHCRLPVGETGYADKSKDGARMLHGECMAQVILHDLESGDNERLRRDAEEKLQRRQEYDIGWSFARIPRNVGPATKLKLEPLPKGMCCLVLGEGAMSIRAAATMEPVAAINLEYLSIALQVRRRHGREPLFSLDPVVPKVPADPNVVKNFKDEMQVKRFEPDWLRGTSVGEVMFQADYHLKELSMGEYEQPVVGMKSCQDLSEAEGDDQEWRAREWFIVRKAEVHLSEDGVLIPYVRMGVEAREQVLTPNGLQDAPITRPDHPLVQYAEAFTRNFDLIAERKSVIYQLREVAKASVLAKFLLDSGIPLEESWFALSGPPREDCKLEIPQLWNERSRAQIRVQDGTIVGGDGEIAPKMRGVYGGVEMGLDRMGGLTLPKMKMTMGRLLFNREWGRVIDPLMLSAQPQGVDLSLEKFNLSDVRRVAGEKQLVDWAGDLQPEDACAALGLSFWKVIDGKSEKLLKDEDLRLLKDVFNPRLSDRRQEADLFVPPDAGFAYITRLRGLVKDEEATRRRRLELFLSEDFCAQEPGPLFPNSWSAGFGIERRRLEAQQSKLAGPAHACLLQARPEYKAQAAVMFEHVLRSAKPAFDKSTEDGIRFRIYRVGSLEVRTTQEHSGEEAVCVVFSVLSLKKPFLTGVQAFGSSDKFVKVTEYVEQGYGMELDGKLGSQRRSYVVLETKQGNAVVTEKLVDGTVTWDENPKDLEDRHSLAKAIRSSTCSITVQGMQRFQVREASAAQYGASRSARKRYAQGAYCWASGASRGSGSGFGKPSGGCRWQLLSVVSRAPAAAAPAAAPVAAAKPAGQ